MEDTGAITGTLIFIMLNIFFIAAEYRFNPDFKDWFDSTVKVGIEQVERRIYK